MKRSGSLFILALFLVMPAVSFGQSPREYVIYDGRDLRQGYGMGVNSSRGVHNWLKDRGNEFVMAYPRGQTWGAVLVTVGQPRPSPGERQSKNFSNFDTLVISMRGARGGERVDIGIKDRTDPDDGSETKKTVTLTREYSPYRFTLRDFVTADLQKLHVITEFVFRRNSACKIYVNFIKFE